LIGEQVALDRLKICFIRQDGTNCGVCAKCTYAVEALALFGALDRSLTMPKTVGRGCIVCTGTGNYGDLTNLLAHVKRLGGRPGLDRAIAKAIADFDRAAWRRAWRSRIRRLAKRRRRKWRLEWIGWLKSHRLPSG
jgi:hypothetical protein